MIRQAGNGCEGQQGELIAMRPTGCWAVPHISEHSEVVVSLEFLGAILVKTARAVVFAEIAVAASAILRPTR